jgi:hypothetical protein
MSDTHTDCSPGLSVQDKQRILCAALLSSSEGKNSNLPLLLCRLLPHQRHALRLELGRQQQQREQQQQQQQEIFSVLLLLKILESRDRIALGEIVHNNALDRPQYHSLCQNDLWYATHMLIKSPNLIHDVVQMIKPILQQQYSWSSISWVVALKYGASRLVLPLDIHGSKQAALSLHLSIQATIVWQTLFFGLSRQQTQMIFQHLILPCEIPELIAVWSLWMLDQNENSKECLMTTCLMTTCLTTTGLTTTGRVTTRQEKHEDSVLDGLNSTIARALVPTCETSVAPGGSSESITKQQHRIHQILSAGGLSPRLYPLASSLPTEMRQCLPSHLWVAKGSLIEHECLVRWIMMSPFDLYSSFKMDQVLARETTDSVVVLAKRWKSIQFQDLQVAVMKPYIRQDSSLWQPWYSTASLSNPHLFAKPKVSSLLARAIILRGETELKKQETKGKQSKKVANIWRALLCAALDLSVCVSMETTDSAKEETLELNRVWNKTIKPQFVMLMETKEQQIEWLTSGWFHHFLLRWSAVLLLLANKTTKTTVSFWSDAFEMTSQLCLSTKGLCPLYTTHRGLENLPEDLVLWYENVYLPELHRTPKGTFPWECVVNSSSWIKRWTRMWLGIRHSEMFLLERYRNKNHNAVTPPIFDFEICDVLDGGLGTCSHRLVVNPHIHSRTGKTKQEWIDQLVLNAQICFLTSSLVNILVKE